MECKNIVLSANGTSDSTADMDFLTFHWDLDTSFDSDGDGNSDNDIDMVGKWIEFDYASSGLKQVKLTVYDEDSSHATLMEIDVKEDRTRSIPGFNAIVGIISLLSALIIHRNPRPSGRVGKT